MTESASDQKPFQPAAKRIQVVERVRTRFPRFGEFVTQYSTNMSMTGMFLRSDEPQPPGSRFEFEFVVSDEAPMIYGVGQVIWVRQEDESDERPAGMGVRFVELDAKSRRVIRWLMEKAAFEGHKPFELGDGSPVGETELVTGSSTSGEKGGWRLKSNAVPVDSQHVRSASSMRNTRVREKRRRRADLLALALIAIIVLGWWVVRLESRVPPDRRDSLSVGEITGSASSEVSASTERGSEAISAGQNEARAIEQILDEVRGWARSWTERNADLYLSFYAQDYETPRGMSRLQWETWRRERLATPEYIRVALAGFEVEDLEDHRATVSFFQSYRSDLLDDTVRKRLTLERQEEGWKILSERVIR